ncbi:hypothetical protein [Hahella ganghwensis]|uniref:hypothetical protein n=1 Tax=Hahella ganghwensis TaxID=286420 RepID=UPI000367BEF4|nr:hypothetical protein [Hahella ganghwensis]
MKSAVPIILLPFVLTMVFLAGCSDQEADISISLTPDQLDWVGQKIFQNECAGQEACLVHWNEGESFPSLGIGHFIWYPAQVDDPFVESFPSLIAYMQKASVSLPPWLETLEPFDAPWPDRDSFLSQQNHSRIQSLREFLSSTRGVQAEFMFARAKASLKRVIEAAPETERETIRQHLDALTSAPAGVYALIDYVNFKGEGLSPEESYQGNGWGLLQVLQQMSEDDSMSPVTRFQQAAIVVLTRRANNAQDPIEREKWLPGWINRLKSYQGG